MSPPFLLTDRPCQGRHYKASDLLNRATQNDLQGHWNSGWLAIQHARCVAILAYRCQNVMVHHWAKRTDDLQVRRLTRSIDRHLDYGLSIEPENPRSVGVRFNPYGADQLWRDHAGRDPERCRMSGVVICLGRIKFIWLDQFGLQRGSTGGLGFCRRICLSVKQHRGQEEGGHNYCTHNI